MKDEGIRVRNTLPFAMVPEWLLDRLDVSASAIRLYCILARYADKETLHAHPSRAKLAERCGVSVKTVDRSLAELVAAGGILVEKRRTEAGDWDSNDYILTPGRDTSVATGRDTSDQGVGTPVSLRTRAIEQESLERKKNSLSVRSSFADDFEDFWKIYPRTEGKAAAKKAWSKATRKVLPMALILGAKRYRDDPNREDAYTLHGSTWLNQERWEDPPLPSRVVRKPDHAAQLLREALDG